MKLTENFQARELERPGWSVYGMCDIHIGHILDNDFEKPYITVYEHKRQTIEEIFHPEIESDHEFTRFDGAEGLEKEEINVASVLRSDESNRRLNIVGDVGVGKSTFLFHLMELHLSSSLFRQTKPLYFDWTTFGASLVNPTPEIRQRFASDLFAGMETLYSEEFLDELDRQVFNSDKIFAPWRAVVRKYADPVIRETKIADAMSEIVLRDPAAMALARVRALCQEKKNEIVLIIDNIDHLYMEILDKLFQLLIEVQQCPCLLIVAMRDHTFESGASAYRRQGTTLSWSTRLHAPNIREMLKKRVNHFLPEKRENPVDKISIGSMSVEVDVANTCRNLLLAPFSSEKAYNFITHWSNHNIRELFRVIQQIVSSSCFSGYDRNVILNEVIRIGIDECIISLALRNSLMFFPAAEKTSVFNPYSAGPDNEPTDQLVGVRILQFLSHKTHPIELGEIKKRFLRWGYTPAALDAQINAMTSKDIVWTNTGAPSDLVDTSKIRLSYRGALYISCLLRRASFNYMMSFDTHAASISHPIVRLHRSEINTELKHFATFDRMQNINTEAFVHRVLGLADVVFEAERRELQALRNKESLLEFRTEVNPNSASHGIVLGLAKLMRRLIEGNGESHRFTLPSPGTLQEVADMHAKYESYSKKHIELI